MQPNSTPELSSPISSPVPSLGVEAPPLDEARSAAEKEKMERIARYSSPEFTRQLLEHMHKATKKAILESQEPQK